MARTFEGYATVLDRQSDRQTDRKASDADKTSFFQLNLSIVNLSGFVKRERESSEILFSKQFTHENRTKGFCWEATGQFKAGTVDGFSILS